MAKELPYFRFTVQEWQNGNISLERYELQGLFISICGFYWLQDCHCTLALLQKKFGNATNEIKELIELGIIKHENKHDKINIDFLVTQFDLLSKKRKLRQVAGSKGGNAKAMLKQKGSYKDNNKDNNKDKEGNQNKDTTLKNLLNDQRWAEAVCMSQKIPMSQFSTLLPKFINDLSAKEDLGKPEKEIKQHFVNWIKFNKPKEQEMDAATRGILKAMGKL